MPQPVAPVISIPILFYLHNLNLFHPRELRLKLIPSGIEIYSPLPTQIDAGLLDLLLTLPLSHLLSLAKQGMVLKLRPHHILHHVSHLSSKVHYTFPPVGLVSWSSC